MIRKAKIKDIKPMQNLINYFAKQDLMLPRSLNELYENLRDYWVADENNKIVGCCGLRICWDNLAEIKSLAVLRQKQGKGIGENLVRACLNEAKELGAKNIFVLTYKPGYFKKFGFQRIKHADLPHKIWLDCINCPKFPGCEEVAMIKKI